VITVHCLRSPLIAFVLTAITSVPAQTAYRNPSLPVSQRMQDLLKRMTLEEKVDQLSSWRRSAMSTDNAEAQQIVEKIQKLSEPGSQVGPRDTAVLRNEAQKFLVERTRLGIPALFQGEALHGFMSNGSTSFPQVLGLASTWDPELVERVFSAAADEMAAAGVRQAFTPVLDLARDPRWGRTEETYGEDPFLVSRMGVAAIRGLQGTSFVIDRHHVLATAKHFAAHGQPEGGRNTAPANYSERILRESFFMPFQAAVEEAHVASVMASYNEIDGIPSHINHWLLDRVLRQEWRFQGYVTSDGGGLQMLVNTHHVAADYAEAARKALAAGVDFDLSDGSVYQTLIEQARRGIIPEKQIDDAVERVLAAKFRLGLFENPYADPDYAAQVTNSREHKELALKAAEEAIVLLKNEGNLLPLDGKKIKSIAVIGPNAADVHLGGYSRDPGPGNQVSILEGIRQRVGAGIKLLYAEGCKLTSAKPGWAGWYVDNVALIDPPTQAQSIQEAAVLARQADVAILVVGENESTNREAWSERHLGDRDSLDLLGAQDKLVQAVIDTGIPTVVFLINGRPLSINYAAQHARAIIEGWYLGEQGGIAAARVLFGDINPGGKLPVTFPRSVGQIPAYYDHKPSRDRSYAFTNSQPLFPFGYGLSYTTFGFDNLRVEPALMDAGGTTTVRVEVTNTGNREGDEIPQLYMHQRVASVTQPVKQLRGFRRVSLRPGEKTTVEFLITPETLSILDINMRGRVEPGTFDIMVGPDSEHTATVPLQIFARE